jgi:hypothetical protein
MRKIKMGRPAVAAVAVLAIGGLSAASHVPAKAPPYSVEIQGHGFNRFYHCRKLVHVAPFYGFRDCRRFYLFPPKPHG